MKLHRTPYRFEHKSYGRGWTPSTRQGRVVTIAYIAIMIAASKIIPYTTRSPQTQGYLMIGIGIGGILLVVAICYLKGPTPRRQRGNKSPRNEDHDQ